VPLYGLARHERPPCCITQNSLQIPPKATRSGEAIIIFDVQDDGSLTNIRIAAYSEKLFGTAAAKAAKNFVYTPATDKSDPRKRLNIPVRTSYVLRNEKNKIIAAKPLKTLLTITENLDLIHENHTIGLTGRRITIRR